MNPKRKIKKKNKKNQCHIKHIKMALTDFFRINMPYGMESNEKGEWMFFNRDYKPIGFNTSDFIDYHKYPVFTKYKALTENKLISLSHQIDKKGIQKDEKGKIYKVYFYNDSTNPMIYPKCWDAYLKKIKMLSKLKI